jgi:hypothetical protein
MSLVRVWIALALAAFVAACQASAPYDTPCATQKDDTTCLWHDYGGGTSP